MKNVCNAISEILKRELPRRLLENELIKGTVTHKNEAFMMVNIDYKQNVKMYAENVWNYEVYKPNTNMLVYIEQIESEANETKLSRGSIDSEEAWTVLTSISSENLTVKGVIQAKMSEGYVVKVLGLTALLPHNLISESMRSQRLVGHVAALRIFELNKPENIIKLKLTGAEEAEVIRSLQFGDKVWGIIKEMLEDSFVLDLCSRCGNLLLHASSQIQVIRLVSTAEVGQIIESINVTTSDETVELVLQDPTSRDEEQLIFVFGILIRVSQYEMIIQISEDEFVSLNNRWLETENVIDYLSEDEVVEKDLVKVAIIRNVRTGEEAATDIDGDVTRYYKYILQNEKFIIYGEAIELLDNAILVDLGDDICGVVEADTNEQAEGAYKVLANKVAKFRIVDYDPDQNIINLEVAADKETTAFLVEA
ncbi:30S ribosomal protein S1 [Candidatus Hodgkinia cicadicola]|nr:30S ribosomal protein S1 [Candidatus Hodgkinia cicadicola]